MCQHPLRIVVCTCAKQETQKQIKTNPEAENYAPYFANMVRRSHVISTKRYNYLYLTDVIMTPIPTLTST